MIKKQPAASRLDRAADVDRVKLIFLAPGDIRKGRVEPISWMRSCEAYAQAGLDVSLVTLRVGRPDGVPRDQLWEHYGIETRFSIRTAPTLLGANAPTWQFRAWAGATALALALPTVSHSISRRPVVVHARAPVLLAPLAVAARALPASMRPLLVFETHTLPSPKNAWIVRSADLVVVNSEKLAADTRSAFGLKASRVLHAPLPPFNPVRPQPKDHARRRIGIGGAAVVACYTGKMTREHNEFFLGTAAAVARVMPRFRMILVGGNPEILAWTKSRTTELGLAGTVVLPGFVAPATVELYQAAADVLVYYIPSSMGIFPYTTPAKGYEYQAAERPIVATDFPLFAEVFGNDGERAIRVVERTPAGLADGILRAISLGDGGKAMVERAAAFVRDRSWSARADMILKATGV